jgi:flagellar assembly protein FliH
MISLSKVIKSFFANNLETEKKTIGLKKVLHESQLNDLKTDFKEQYVDYKSNLQDEQLQKAVAEAENIRKEAQLEYELFQERMTEEAILNQQKTEELFKQAEENGYNEGFQLGLQEGQRQYETFIKEAREIVTSSKNDYFNRLEEAEPIIVQLAVEVAGKIVSNALKEDLENWLSIVKAVINEVREQEQVKLYIHPNWYEFTLAHKEELRLLLPNCNNLYIYPDAHLQENGCQIETPYGKIDASVDSQLAEIKYALLEKLKELGGYEGS